MEENKYKAAHERVKSAIKECGNNLGRIKMIESIFPELKESEDERIRKGIFYMFEMALPDVFKRYGINKNDAISYIEKLKDFDKQLEVQYNRGYDAGYIEGRAFTKEELEKQDEQKVSVDDFKAKNWYVSEVDGKIHDMTYNPADNVEPKFKVGDWITNSIETVQITGYDIDYGYQVDCKGNLQHRDTDIIEKEYHLWTIQDAKDGDVLYSLDTNQPFIYKARNIHEQATAYCGINKYGKFFVWNTNDCIITLDKYIPATKEQRELLFRKMKEAGYVWNPTTKELSHKEVTKKSDKVWNEEDEEMKDLIDEISCHNDDVDYETHVRITRWLNELKQRLS